MEEITGQEEIWSMHKDWRKNILSRQKRNLSQTNQKSQLTSNKPSKR